MPNDNTSERQSMQANVLVFIVSIFSSAFLIFLVQPMVGKRILPWFGGTAAVWMVCLAFYQTALFLGYAYAHLLIRFARPAVQLAIHFCLVLLALMMMPVLPEDSWQPEGVSTPISDIVSMLSANVLLPFLILASTGPLVQAWFARLHPTRSPYPLYAVSNAGSLLALLAYPLLIEPRLGLATTGGLWTYAFVVTGALVIGCCALALRSSQSQTAINADGDRADESEPLDAYRVALWLLLSASAVMALMGVTNRLCRDVASVPFLWIYPLAIYLVTLILCFGSERVFKRGVFIVLALGPLILTHGDHIWWDWEWAKPVLAAMRFSLPTQITAYGLLLFSISMLMHGELYRLRPPPRALTAFYLTVAAGGALGGLFVGLAAPAIFTDYHELAVGLAVAWALIPITFIYERTVRREPTGLRWLGAVMCLPALCLVLTSFRIAPPDVIHKERTFFGVVHVAHLEMKHRTERRLYHGRTIHGTQIWAPWGSITPTAYFGHASPIGLLLDERKRGEGTRVGVIGLGAGTLASYGRTGDLFRFYEIDPAVVSIASEGGLFQFLEASRAKIETVIGDGRLALDHERATNVEQNFDFLILDAFSSDSVPIHLLTREAFKTYTAALKPNGILVMHVSNQHLELMPQIARQGSDIGMSALMITNTPSPRHESDASQWVFLSPGHHSVDTFAEEIRAAWKRLALPPSGLDVQIARSTDESPAAVWTDDYSDLASVVLID